MIIGARIVVIGSSGSGKTTFARHLAAETGLPYIELDALYWKPHWEEPPRAEFRDLVHNTLKDRWVVDGNYSKVRDIVWPRATTLIWLNYPFFLVMGRLFRRTWRRAWTQEELFGGNRETLRRSFLSTDSILVWALTNFHRIRRGYRAVFDGPAYAHLHKIECQNPEEAARLLEEIATA